MKLSEVLAFLENSDDCTITYEGRKLTYLNEAGTPSDRSKFFLAGFEHGPSWLIHVESYHGDGFESAWEAWVDSMHTIDKEELIEAYSPGRGKGSFLDMAVDAEREDTPDHRVDQAGHDEWWDRVRRAANEALEACEEAELVEGYSYQSNATGTGIVSMGHYAQIHEADLSEIEITVKEEA